MEVVEIAVVVVIPQATLTVSDTVGEGGRTGRPRTAVTDVVTAHGDATVEPL